MKQNHKEEQQENNLQAQICVESPVTGALRPVENSFERERAPRHAPTVTLPSDVITRGKEIVIRMLKAGFEARKASVSVTNSTGGPFALSLIKASGIRPKKIRWLWENRLPFGKLTLFVGDPGMEKSLVSTYVAAVTTTGQKWYGSTNVSPSEVLIFASEDDYDDTIVPRLMAAGANLDKIHFEKLKSGRSMQLDRDIKLIRKVLAENPKIRLVIVDPVSNYLGDIKMNDEQAVRRVLGPLKGIAEETSVAIVGIMHLNKKADLQAINRVGGAMAFVGVARAVWLFCQDNNTPGEFQMLSVKQNIGKRVAGLKYKIDMKNVEIEREAVAQPCISSIGEAEKSANDVLTSPRFGATATEFDKAVEWLKNILSNAPMQATEVLERAKEAGFSEKTLRRAKQELDVQSEQRIDGWYWELKPDPDGQLPERVEDGHLTI
jgi:putative DNA primase/helicase